MRLVWINNGSWFIFFTLVTVMTRDLSLCSITSLGQWGSYYLVHYILIFKIKFLLKIIFPNKSTTKDRKTYFYVQTFSFSLKNNTKQLFYLDSFPKSLLSLGGRKKEKGAAFKSMWNYINFLLEHLASGVNLPCINCHTRR